MRCTTRRAAAWLALALLLAAGCRQQRLNVERTVTLEGGLGWKTLEFDPPRSEQKLTVTVTSPGVPVNAYLVKAADAPALQTALERGQAPTSTLAQKEKAEDIMLEATVPAKTGFTLVLQSNKKTDAKVKVVGR
jgi:hypothetical protein